MYMSEDMFEIRTLNLKREKERSALEYFLNASDLTLEEDVDYAVCLMDREKIIASGCASSNILKCIAVDPEYQGMALTNKIISYLRLRGYHRGFSSLFIYTKPENRKIFEDLGFFTIALSDEALLLENRKDGIENYLGAFQEESKTLKGSTAAIVMNCNPFSLGHRYLIEKACSENALVHLFVVEEDLSVFPFEERIELVRMGCEDLENLRIHAGGGYIISRATFPTYFIKDKKIVDEVHSRLDLDLFGSRIAPALGITRRYVGEEPFCPVTASYNRLMKSILPDKGIEVVEIPRKEVEGTAVSASRIREALVKEEWEDLEKQVPPATLAYLKSEAGMKIVQKLREKKI